VGLGTQDSLSLAEQFVTKYELSHTMLWDKSGQSWVELGIASQPAGLLIAADGRVISTWRGGIPEEQVLAQIAKL
jgi:peroxiredoxin